MIALLALALLSVALSAPLPLTSSEITAMVNKHNVDRARFCSKPLTWNATLARVAQAYAEKCIWGHNADRNKQAGRQVGENIAYSGSMTTDLYALWASEEKQWTCPRPYSSGIGHWTQIIWKDTVTVGCGRANCPNMRNYVVCNYAGPGNYLNVAPVSQCNNAGCSATRPPTTKAPTRPPTTLTPTTKAPTRPPTTKAPTRSPTRSPTRPPTTKAPTRSGPTYKKCLKVDSSKFVTGWRYATGWTAYNRAITGSGRNPGQCRKKCLDKGFSVFGMSFRSGYHYCSCYASVPSGTSLAQSNCKGPLCNNGAACVGGTGSYVSIWVA